jgi:hypothetical protein
MAPPEGDIKVLVALDNREIHEFVYLLIQAYLLVMMESASTIREIEDAVFFPTITMYILLTS